MESVRSRLIRLLQGLVWFADYLFFEAVHPIKRHMPERVKKILIIEYLFIGDLIAVTPVIRAVKNKFPSAGIDVLVRKEMKDVLAKNPSINEIIGMDKDELLNEDITIEKLKQKNYDIAILLHPGIDIGCRRMCRILKKANIKFRLGCTKVGIKEGKGHWLHRKTKPTFRLKHKIEDNLDVVKAIGIESEDKRLEVYTTKKAEEFIGRFKRKNKMRRYGVIHAAPQHETHKWIEERFAEVADRIIKKYGIKIIFTGGKKDIEYNAWIINLMKGKQSAINSAGTSIQEFLALIKNAEFVISTDTGAMHVAAGFNKPIVSLFGAGNPRIWSPWCNNSIVIFKEKEACTSCMKHRCRFAGSPREMECMKSIAIEDVLNAVEILEKK